MFTDRDTEVAVEGLILIDGTTRADIPMAQLDISRTRPSL